MLSLLLRPLRGAVAVLLANDSPRQVATAVALGAVIGLVPKGNLIAVSLVVLLCSLQINRTAGLMSAAIFSWIGFYLDGFSHRVGAQLLSIEWLQPQFATLYDLPLGPWIGFHNTVVMGSLLVGLYLAYPVYVLASGYSIDTKRRWRRGSCVDASPAGCWVLTSLHD